MKKFLLTAAMLVMGFVATFAQSVPDASKWKVGDELEGIIQNPSFTTPKAVGIVWEYTDAPDPRVDESLFESYSSGTKTQVFQYVLLPKGKYRVTCQGYYRGGGADQDAANFADYDEKWQNNAWLFVQNGEYKDETFKGGHIFKTPLMPRLFEHVQEQIYFKASDEADWADDHWYAAANAWGPGGSNGSRAWFEAGKYSPYEQDDVMYNIVDFFLSKDGYVKLGAMKTGEQSGGDTFFVTNVKLYYQGAVTEEDELMVLQGDCDDLLNELKAIKDDDNNKGLLRTKLDDELTLFIQNYGGDDAYSFNLDEAKSAKNELEALKAGVMDALNGIVSLKGVIASINALVATTNFAGLSDLKTALEKAQSYLSPTYDYNGADPWTIFATQAAALSQAQYAYLMSSEEADGSHNFSSFITNPFFCDPEYNPVWDDDANIYKFQTINDEEGNPLDETLQIENSWLQEMEKNYSDLKSAHADWIPFCETVKISDSYVENQWYVENRKMNGRVVVIQHGLPASGGWVANPTNDPERLCQTITGLPNGYYSMSAMMCNAGAEITEYQYAFIKAGDAEKTAPLTKKGSAWWSQNLNQWRTVWEKITTDLIKVTDGKVTIGVSSDAFYYATGFQLYYYGETIDYAKMLKPSIDKVKENVESLPWKGDKDAVDALLATIPATISDDEGFEKASEIIEEANTYITKAKAATTNWKTPDNFLALAQAKAENDEEVGTFLLTAYEEALNLAESEKSVYTDAIDYDNRYTAYDAYVLYRESVGEYLNDDAVKSIISEQNDYLKNQIATVEKLDEFKTVIATPYNQAKFKDLGAETATLDKPVDVSYVLINPKFHEGHSKGWYEEGEKNLGTWCNDNLGIEFVEEDGNIILYKTISEIYGTEDAYTFSQTLNGMPAGTYEVRTHATFRDSWRPDGFSAYLENEAKGDLAKYNLATLFAEGANGKNRQETFVKSIYSTKLTEPSFTYYTEYVWYQYDSDSKIYDNNKVEYLTDFEDESSLVEKGVIANAYDGKGKSSDGIYPVPFDCNNTVTTYVEDPEDEYSEPTPVETVYYFPQRTVGVVQAIKKDINNYYNKVVVYLPELGSLKIGIDKAKSDGNASLMMYDWEIFYCGKDAPTAINEVVEATTEGEGAVEYYSINGVKLNAPQAGLNIVKYANGVVRKVFINK